MKLIVSHFNFRNYLVSYRSGPLPPSLLSPLVSPVSSPPSISKSRSVDTIALTKSFGWEGSEVFQQQDVQELCRVLFDNLEGSFKGTEVENAIDEIYAGEMVDYVKCIDIDYQSERRDKFLDCSLAIRPYGSSKSMRSLNECLEHYLEPEILDGDNKYYAESVERKVDAIKGLKFSRLPPILSVQLKRFVYDFSGDSIIQMKINDEVKFPLILDLNKYVSRCQKLSTSRDECDEKGEETDGGRGVVTEEPREQIIDEFEEFLQKKIFELREKKAAEEQRGEEVTGDGVCTSPSTDRKGADWKSGQGSPASLVYEYDHLETKDDLDVPDLVDYTGQLHPDIISSRQAPPVTTAPVPVGPVTPPQSGDIESSSQDPFTSPTSIEQINLQELVEQRGEWIYELYAVLVHSGAISGGHYYVYIKDIETNKWWNFNDSYVDEITVEKVLQASGGMVNQSSYYGVKSQMLSSANAYMLMYRKVSVMSSAQTGDTPTPPRSYFPSDEMVPEYIRDELAKLTELAEKRRKEDEARFNRLPLQIFWRGKAHHVVTDRYASYKSLLQQIWTELDLFNSTEFQEILSKDQELDKQQQQSEAEPRVMDPLLVPTDQVRLRIFSSYNKVKQEPIVVETRGNMSLEAIRITTYRELFLELRSRHEEWEVYEPDGINLQLLEYDPQANDFKAPVAIRLPRASLFKDLRNKLAQLPGTKHLDLSACRILKLTIWSFADVKVEQVFNGSVSEAITAADDKLRLLVDLRLCEGLKLYIESNSIPLDQSPCVQCFTSQVNRINILVNNPTAVDEAERTLTIDRRKTMNDFRELVSNELKIAPDGFRIFRKTAPDAELNGEKGQSLHALGIYNGIAFHLALGKPLLPGHYLIKLFLYKPTTPSLLHDLQTMTLPETKTGGAEVGVEDVSISLEEGESETNMSPPIVEASATLIDLTNDDCPMSPPDSVRVIEATPITVTATPMSLNDIDIDVLTKGVGAVGPNKPEAFDPFKINDDTPESSPNDIIGFGYKMVHHSCSLPNSHPPLFLRSSCCCQMTDSSSSWILMSRLTLKCQT
jgi:hypothetical protein